jgi:hypothetical protein
MEQKRRRKAKPRSVPHLSLPAAGILKSVNVEVFGAAAAAVADVAMEEAMDELMGVIGPQSRAWRDLRL